MGVVITILPAVFFQGIFYPMQKSICKYEYEINNYSVYDSIIVICKEYPF